MATVVDNYQVVLPAIDYSVANHEGIAQTTYKALLTPSAGKVAIIHAVLAINTHASTETEFSLWAGTRQIMVPVPLKTGASGTSIAYAPLRPHKLRAGEQLKCLCSVAADVNASVYYEEVDE